MPYDLEITPIYPTLNAVFADGKCIGVVIPRLDGMGVVFFHYESATLTYGIDEEAAIDSFFNKEW